MATSVGRSTCFGKRCILTLFKSLVRRRHTIPKLHTGPSFVSAHEELLKTRPLPCLQPYSIAVKTSARPYSWDVNKQSCSNPPLPTDPYQLVQEDLSILSTSIRKELALENNELTDSSQYHFDGKGKSFRPMVVSLMAHACNIHTAKEDRLLPSQHKIAMIAEMIHTASLIHDDVIDASLTRRGNPSAFGIWGQRKAILCGDYVMAISSTMLARIGNTEVVKVLAQVLDDLVSGEFMQLGSKENENERFTHYLKKTYKKTASLMANSCKAVAILSDCSPDFTELAFEYGRNLGIAFQLIDDLLDFISNEQLMGKPTTADLKLGLATGPVLFAAQQYPELNPMIMRRFNHKGDVERAMQLVEKSDGVEQTRFLAQQHCNEAIKLVKNFKYSAYRDALVIVTEKMLSRMN